MPIAGGGVQVSNCDVIHGLFRGFTPLHENISIISRRSPTENESNVHSVQNGQISNQILFFKSFP